MEFDAAFDRLIGFEGGYANNAHDPGGETMFGVTNRVARAHNYRGDMRLLPRETAKAIYRSAYWDSIQADALPDGLRFDVFDAAVNSGPAQAVKWLQRVVGVIDDGLMGPTTIEAANRIDAKAAAAALIGQRLDLMTSLPNWAGFSKGWCRRLASNLKALVAAE